MILNKINKYKGFRLFAFAGSLAFALTLSSCRETFTPLDIPEDVLSPGEVKDFVGMPLDGAINLTWKAPIDFDHRGYELTYTPGGETPIELGKVKSYEVLGLENGTEYAFTLKSFDIVGNVSEGVTTFAVPNVPSDNGLVSIVEGFDISAPNLPEGWTTYTLGSSADWYAYDPNGDGNYVMEANNYGAEEPAHDWLITPAMELAEGNTAVLNFDYSTNYEDAEGFGLDVRVSNDYTGTGDPTLATWISLSAGIDNGLWQDDLIKASPVSLSDYSGTVYVAFVYTSSGSSGNSDVLQARVDNISIVEKPTYVDESFDISAPNLPKGWSAISLGSSADWYTYDPNGDGNYVMEANNYGAEEPAHDWLITPAMEIEEGNTAVLNFDYSTNYEDAEGFGLDVRISTDYSGVGDPTLSTWTSLSAGINNGLWQDELIKASPVSLSAYSGTVYIAFVYQSTGSSGNSDVLQARIDNIVIK